jgi:hypothetical protein
MQMQVKHGDKERTAHVKGEAGEPWRQTFGCRTVKGKQLKQKKAGKKKKIEELFKGQKENGWKTMRPCT